MDMRTVEEKREYLVVKSSELIQNTRKELNSIQIDFIDTIISKVKPNDDRYKVYSISIDEFCQLKGINTSNNISYIKRQVDEIDNQKFYIRNEKGKLVRIRWFDVLRIVPGDSTIEYSFSEDIKDFVHHLNGTDRYTKFRLSHSLVLKSQYSKYIYQYLKSWEKRGFDRISIEHFIQYECPCPYKQFSNLKQRVLEPAIKEINAYTDLKVTYTPTKERGSRKYTHLYFKIEHVSGMESIVHETGRQLRFDKEYRDELRAEADKIIAENWD